MGPRPAADEQLIELARNGDRHAQQELWRGHRRWVAAIILAHRPHSAELEDLLQDVAVKFIDKIHTLRDCGAFRPWLRQIALNVCRGAARSARPTLRFGSPAEDERDTGRVTEPADERHATEGLVERYEAAERVLQQALSLPVAYREPLLLRCLRSMSYQQIGELLDLPVTTIETRLARARKMLREEVPELEAALSGTDAEYAAKRR